MLARVWKDLNKKDKESNFVLNKYGSVPQMTKHIAPKNLKYVRTAPTLLSMTAASASAPELLTKNKRSRSKYWFKYWQSNGCNAFY